jgi:hypothetical protein
MDWLRSEDLKEEKNVTAPILIVAVHALCRCQMPQGGGGSVWLSTGMVIRSALWETVVCLKQISAQFPEPHPFRSLNAQSANKIHRDKRR